MTEFIFDPEDTPELEYPVKVALGFASQEAKAAVYNEMARRMAGEKVLCGVVTSEEPTDGGEEPTGATEVEGTQSGSATASMAASVFILALSFLFG